MPSGVYKRTKEHIENMSKAQKGKPRPWLIGSKRTEDTRKKMSITNKGRKISDEHKEKLRQLRIDKKLSEETKNKISKKLKNRTLTEDHRRKIGNAQVGEKNHNWKGGTSPENRQIRKSIDYKIWNKNVFERDDYTCQKTKIKGGILHAHHIENFSNNKELRFCENNGITLSKESHEEFHKKYGRTNNTKEQLIEYLNN